MVIFSHLIDVAGINSYKLWLLKYPDWNKTILSKRKMFLLAVGKELIKENVYRRYNNKYIQKNQKRHMTDVFPELLEITEPTVEKQNYTRGRCHICQRGKDRKTRKICVKCDNFVCLEHAKSEIVCVKCTNAM